MATNKFTQDKIQELLARARATVAERVAREEQARIDAEKTAAETIHHIEPIGEAPLTALSNEDQIISQVLAELNLTSNAEQMEFCRLMLSGKNGILIGAAGTGKTTTQGLSAEILMRAGKVPPLDQSTKWLRAGSPGVAIVSFTNKAVNNIRQKMPEDLRANCITFHKLLEFAPIYYEIPDPEDANRFIKTMRFEPTRNRFNPLPSSLKLLIVEEASMVAGTSDYDTKYLWGLFKDACQHEIQIIMLGDLYQLPPVYGTSILGYKLSEWPVVELTRIFRQAEESPIISLAWRIKNGEVISGETEKTPDGKRIRVPAFEELNVPGKLLIRPWQKKLSELDGLRTSIAFFTNAYNAGEYNPDDDIILIPFNKAFGSIELNRGISDYLGKKRNATVFEVIAGFNKHYLAVGDKILYEKEDHFIVDIIANADYTGKRPQPESTTLDRWGHQSNAKVLQDVDHTAITDEALDAFMNSSIAGEEDEDKDKVNKASHTLVLRRVYDDTIVEIDSAGDVNNIIGGYAITVHKAQGSEWPRVFCVFHHTHATMLQRELLYTAVTRAKEQLVIICEPNTFERGINSVKIKGTTLAEKAEWFKGKQEENERLFQQNLMIQKRLEETGQLAKAKGLRVEDLVSEAAKDAARIRLDDVWKRAKEFNLAIGDKPGLLFNLRRQDWLGCAQYVAGVIKLNAVYYASSQEAADFMLEDTIPHEVAHILNWRRNRLGGHGDEWKWLAAALGANPARIATQAMPEFLTAKHAAFEAKFAEFESDESSTQDGDIE